MSARELLSSLRHSRRSQVNACDLESNGIIVWETQKVDYSKVGVDLPVCGPRGCPRGATFLWYVYSPIRVSL